MLRRCLTYIPLVLTILALLGMALVIWALPALVRHALTRELGPRLGLDISVGEVSMDPLNLRASIADVAVRESATAKPLLGFALIDADLEWRPLFAGRVVFSQLAVHLPEVHLVRRASGELNSDPIIQRLLNDPELLEFFRFDHVPPIEIRQLAIVQGKAGYRDEATAVPFETVVTPISLVLENLTTERDRHSPVSFSAITDTGAKLEWRGSVRLLPLFSEGRFTLTDVRLNPYSPFYRDFIHYDLGAAALDLDLPYRFDPAAGGDFLKLEGASLALRHLRIQLPDEAQSLVHLPEMRLEGVDLSLRQQTVRAARFSLTQGAIRLEQSRSGVINLLSLRPKSLPGVGVLEQAPEAVQKAAQGGWQWSLGEVVLRDVSVLGRDHKPSRTAAARVQIEDLRVTGANSDLNSPLQVSLKARVNRTGVLTVSGSVVPATQRVDLMLDAAAMPLNAAQPYLADLLDLRVERGVMSLQGQAQGTPQALSFDGQVRVADLRLRESVHDTFLVGLQALQIDGLHLGTAPLSASGQRLVLERPEARLERNAKGSVNLLRALRLADVLPLGVTLQPATPPSPAAPVAPVASTPAVPAAAPRPLPPFQLGEVVVQDGLLLVSDAAVQPIATTRVEHFNATVRGISSDPQGRVQAEFSASLNTTGTLRGEGSLVPLDPLADAQVKVSLAALDLTPYTSYASRYLGYPIEKGQFSYAAEIQIKNSQLRSDNRVVLDQLTLGRKTNSPEAIQLPVKLGLAVLEDRNGVVDIQVPVAGDLNDPTIRYRHLVWQAVRNVFVKAATSPFTFLAGLAGGGPELSQITFAPGATALDDPARATLDSLAKTLAARPRLGLEISALPRPGVDAQALARLQLEERLKALVTSDDDFADLDPARAPDRERLVEALHEQAVEAGRLAEDTAVDPAAREQALMTLYPVDPKDLEALLRAREAAVRAYLLEQGKVTPDRLFLVPPPAGTLGGSEPQVHFSLR